MNCEEKKVMHMLCYQLIVVVLYTMSLFKEKDNLN